MWWVSVNPKPEFDIRRFHSLRRLKHQNGLSNVVNDKGRYHSLSTGIMVPSFARAGR
jgi:hypothetical protein